MSARERILARVRAATPERAAPHPGAHPLPDASAGGAAFAAALRAVGGEVHGPFAPDALAHELAALAHRRAPQGRRVATAAVAARGLAPPGFEIVPDAADPRGLDDVAVAVLAGVTGVAENGAVAVPAEGAGPHALAFLCAHLLLLLPQEAVVPDLHRAFAALPPALRAQPRLVWISGPSKTADIEQTLVVGAHGPLSLDVLLHAPR